MAQAQAQSGTSAYFFGREKRVEYFVKVLWSNPRPAISYGNSCVMAQLLCLDQEASAVLLLTQGILSVVD